MKTARILLDLSKRWTLMWYDFPEGQPPVFRTLRHIAPQHLVRIARARKFTDIFVGYAKETTPIDQVVF